MSAPDVVPFMSRQQPIGTYRAVSCRDAASLERNGQPYYDYNRLNTRDGRPECEVQFSDGIWLLADPTLDITPGFCLDAAPDRVYLAHTYGEPWNGWATPIIDRFTHSVLLKDCGEEHRWDGTSVWVGDDESPFTPRHDGLYDTCFLGWTFLCLTT